VASPLVQITALRPRERDQLVVTARAVQANLYALRTALKRHMPDVVAEVRTPSPGPVLEAREVLIDWRVLRDHAPEETALRLRQVWGEFTALCWLFHHADPHSPPDFVALPPDHPLRCPGHVQDKIKEVQTGLWRLTHERRVRTDPAYRAAPEFKAEHDFALAHPIKVFGRAIHQCDDADLLVCACEYAGMLAALRWAIDDRWAWEGSGIMDVSIDAANG